MIVKSSIKGIIKGTDFWSQELQLHVFPILFEYTFVYKSTFDL